MDEGLRSRARPAAAGQPEEQRDVDQFVIKRFVAVADAAVLTQRESPCRRQHQDRWFARRIAIEVFQ